MIPESIPTENLHGISLTEKQKEFYYEYVKKNNFQPSMEELEQCMEIKDTKNNENMEPEKPKVKRRELLKQIASLDKERSELKLEIESLKVKVRSLNDSISLNYAISQEYQNQIDELKSKTCQKSVSNTDFKLLFIMTVLVGLLSLLSIYISIKSTL